MTQQQVLEKFELPSKQRKDFLNVQILLETSTLKLKIIRFGCLTPKKTRVETERKGYYFKRQKPDTLFSDSTFGSWCVKIKQLASLSHFV